MKLPFPIKLHWLIDIDIIGEKHQTLPQQLRSLGYKVTTLSATKTIKLIKDSSELAESIYTFHGSFEELNQVRKQNVDITTYGLGPSVLRSYYTSYTPNEWFLNQEATLTTWGMFRRNYEAFFSHFEGNEIFIRPDSGNKTFTGRVMSCFDFFNEADIQEQMSNVRPETIIWISSVKPIDSEYRFWISNKKVIASTEYSWSNKKIENKIPDCAFTVANIVANYKWQLDRIYVVDIALSNSVPYVVEFNSFSCSGLYECDSETLFRVVSEDILKEWNDI